MKKYVITNIVENYGEEIEVCFTRNGRKYRLVTDALWDPYDQDDILPDGYDLFIEGDDADTWLKLADEYARINYYSFNEALKVYFKKKNLTREDHIKNE